MNMKRLRILLADDHRIVAAGLKLLLEDEFELLDTVEDGRALLKAAIELDPDVIVADISMPELNGVEALEEIRLRNPNARVVFLTMHQNPVYARRALEAGALGYVVKSSAAEELVLAVRAAAAGRTFISSAVAGELLADLKGKSGAGEDPAKNLTLRQREILRLLVDGLSAKEIARNLDISPRTVEFHKYSMMQALGIPNTAGLIRFALETGIHEV